MSAGHIEVHPLESSNAKEWYYRDERTGHQHGPVTLDELDACVATGALFPESHVASVMMLRGGAMSNGITYSSIARLNVKFTPTVAELHTARNDKPVTVLSGPNNGGKSLLLKQLFYRIGHEGHLMACNRFSHITVLNTRERNANEHRQYYNNFTHQFHTLRHNSEETNLKLEQVIVSLTDTQRDKLFSIAKELLGNQFSLKRTEPDKSQLQNL